MEKTVLNWYIEEYEKEGTLKVTVKDIDWQLMDSFIGKIKKQKAKTYFSVWNRKSGLDLGFIMPKDFVLESLVCETAGKTKQKFLRGESVSKILVFQIPISEVESLFFNKLRYR